MWGRRGGDELDAAERYAERRWIAVVAVTLVFAAFGLVWVAQLRAAAAPAVGGDAGARAQGAGLVWAIWGMVVLRATFGPGGLQWSAPQRRVLNDELAVADRRTAAAVGYWTLLAGLAVLCGAAVAGAAAPGTLLRVAVPGRVTVGVAAPALVFSALQRRAGAVHDADGGRET